MKGYFTFQWGAGGVVFQMGASFLSGLGGCPWGASILMEGFSKKIVEWGMGHPPCPPPPLWETLKPFIRKGLLEEME